MEHDPTERTEIYFKRRGSLERQNGLLDGAIKTHMGNTIQWQGRPEDRELIRRFQQSLLAKGKTKAYRVAKLTGSLRIITGFLETPLNRIKKAEAETFLARVNMHPPWSPHTRRDYIRNFKQFYLWYEEEDPRLENGDEEARKEARKFYQYVRKISTAHPKKSLDYSSIITEKDLTELLKGCENLMERALTAFLHESGCRVGELLGMRIRHIERKGQYALVWVDGKTGERRIPVMKCLPALEAWLLYHPGKADQDSLVWVSTHNGHLGEPLRYVGVQKILSRLKERTGCKKRLNPHWFRHSRATILGAQGKGEALLCKFMGWELGSKQVRTYVHLGAKQVEDDFLREHGMTFEKIEEIKTLHCYCGANNEPEARYCHVCGKPLSIQIMAEDEKKKNAAIEEAMREYAVIMADPQRRAAFEAFQKILGGGA